MMEEFRTIKPNMGLKEAIFQVLSKHSTALTVDEIVNSIKRLHVPYEVNATIVNRVLQKLAKQDLVEFVYLDLSYGVRLKEHAKHPVAG